MNEAAARWFERSAMIYVWAGLMSISVISMVGGIYAHATLGSVTLQFTYSMVVALCAQFNCQNKP